MASSIQSDFSHPNLIVNSLSPPKKVSYVVFTILGILSLGIAIIGLTRLGNDFNWWSAPRLNAFSHISAISMLTGGGILPLLFFVLSRRPSFIPTLNGTFAIGSLYTSANPKNICNLVYCKPDLGFACIVEGAVHNNQKMRAALSEHFDSYVKRYTIEVAPLKSPSEVSNHFVNSTLELEKAFSDKELPLNKRKICSQEKEVLNDPIQGTFIDPAYKPSISIVQLAKEGDEIIMHTAMIGKTMVTALMEDGTFFEVPLGAKKWDKNVEIRSYDVTKAKRIIGFSGSLVKNIPFAFLKSSFASQTTAFLVTQLKELITKKLLYSERSEEEISQPDIEDIGLFVLDLAP